MILTPGQHLRAFQLGQRVVRAALAPLISAWARLRPRSRRPGARPVLALMDEHAPDPRLGAGYPRSHALVEAVLAAGWDVQLLLTEASRYEAAAFALAAPPGLHVRRMRKASSLIAALRSASPDALLVSRPSNLERLLHAPALVEAIRREAPLIYDAEAIFSQREARRRALFSPIDDGWTLEEALRREIDGARSADAVVTVNAADAAVFVASGVGPVRIVGHRCEARSTRTAFGDRSGILFVGRLDGERRLSPNVDSICWFTSEILPLVRLGGGAPPLLHIVGEVLSSEVAALASDQVKVHGRVDDLSPFFDRCRIFIAPTRFSAGVPHKVHEAASHGLPCVVTSTIAEQSGFASPGALLVGDTPLLFAQACARLSTDPLLWTRTREAALEACRSVCSPAAFQASVTDLLSLAQDLRPSTRAHPAGDAAAYGR